MKNSLTLILIFIFSFSYCQSERDSIYFQYSDFDAYKILSSNLNLSGSDSLSRFNLSGSNSKTMYEKYSKNDFGIKGDLSIINNSYEFGCLLSTNHISNSSLTHPTFNDIQIMPSFGYNSKYFDIQTAFGYISKVDEVSQKQGQNLSLKGNYIIKDDFNNLNLNSNLSADNTDDDYNYSNSSKVAYLRLFEGDFGNISVNGSGNIHQYHFSDYSENLFKIKRYEYDVQSGFLYIASDKISNISNLRFYIKNKDSYKNDSKLSYNSNSVIGLSDEIIYDNNQFLSSFKIDLDSGSDKFSLDYEENDKSLSFYNFSLSSASSYKLYDCRFGIFGKFFKHEYKSLTNSNLEDRDIVKISLKPDANYTVEKKISITQSFPLEYYRLINISSQRSVNNYTDRVVNSVTDIKADFNDDLYITGKMQFRSYFRSYDYDDKFVTSFVIKNYSMGDTVSYKIIKHFFVKLSNHYIYEEFGNFNYDNFTENPINYKNHYYTSVSFLLERIKNLKFRLEYYFYEIDSYNFNQDDFAKSDLTKVYISHGPKFGINYTLNNFHFFSGLDIDNFRFNQRQIKFRIESYISFD